MSSVFRVTKFCAALSLLLVFCYSPARADVTLLNVSYDVTREFYKDVNPRFIASWKAKTGETLRVNQSHGGSTTQARSVVEGLEADVISMNQASDIDILHSRGNLIPADWAKRLPHNSAPYISTTVLLVRKGNPKNIRDWSDLAKPGVSVVIPNPKTSGNGRYSYLAAWGYIIKTGGSEQNARDFVTKLFANVPVFDGGGRGATTTFAQRNIGDALLTFESEVQLIQKEFANADIEVIYPSVSVLAEAPVTIVDRVVDKKGTRRQAQAYLDFLYSDEGQELAAKHHFRPRSEKILKQYSATFKPVKLFTIDEVFGGWPKAQKTHFDDGGIFDQIIVKR